MALSNTSDGITRREFFKNTAIKGTTAVALSAGGMAIPVSAQSAKSAKASAGTIREAARQTKVCRTADVVVVGGGPGGIGAALAAAGAEPTRFSLKDTSTSAA